MADALEVLDANETHESQLTRHLFIEWDRNAGVDAAARLHRFDASDGDDNLNLTVHALAQAAVGPGKFAAEPAGREDAEVGLGWRRVAK